MFRLWGKLIKNNHILKDMVVTDETDLNRTKKVFNSLDKLCVEFDLSNPIWLDSNIRDFQKNAKTRFSSDSFIESIEFDFFEIQVLEED